MIDMEKDIDIPKHQELSGIAILAERQVKLQAELAELENMMNLKKEELKQVAEIELPETMLNLGLQSFTLANGAKLSIKTFYRGSIPKARQEEAFGWLKDNGHDDLIKNEVTSVFGKGEDEYAHKLMDNLEEQGWNFENKKTVHPSTLKAFVREQLERGNSIPLDVLGVYIGHKSEIGR